VKKKHGIEELSEEKTWDRKCYLKKKHGIGSII